MRCVNGTDMDGVLNIAWQAQDPVRLSPRDPKADRSALHRPQHGAEPEVQCLPQTKPVIALAIRRRRRANTAGGGLPVPSRRHQPTSGLAQQVDALRDRLPGLDPTDISYIASSSSAPQAMQALLDLADDLKAAPLSLTDEQLVEVARHGGRDALETLHQLRHVLLDTHVGLTTGQAVAIASRKGGGEALVSLCASISDLRKSDGLVLRTDQVVAIAASYSGNLALEAVSATMPVLREQGFSTDEVISIVSTCAGSAALRTIATMKPALCGPSGMGLSTAQVKALARSQGGHHTLRAVHALMPALRQSGLTTEEVVAIANRHSAKHTLPALQETLASLPTLLKSGISAARIAAVARETYGTRTLASLARTMHVLRGLGLTPDQAMELASQRQGRPALHMVDATISKCRDVPSDLDLRGLLDLGKAHRVLQPKDAVRALWAAVQSAERRLTARTGRGAADGDVSSSPSALSSHTRRHRAPRAEQVSVGRGGAGELEQAILGPTGAWTRQPERHA